MCELYISKTLPLKGPMDWWRVTEGQMGAIFPAEGLHTLRIRSVFTFPIMQAIKYPDKGGVSVKIVKYRSEFLCLSFGKTLKTREDGDSKLVAITRRGKKPLGTYWLERPTNYTQDRSSQTVRLPRTHPHKSDQVQGHEKNNSKRKTPIASSNY